ncbi:hypothetical protein HAX54_043468 [Datura stramonium]|uniref:Uncharacterized protein n=1 Tax=Datura stramonium TaxID=4076 RepID=A0ABS8W115_DATST|nr:hypothetical protein [Datura stramonium]
MKRGEEKGRRHCFAARGASVLWWFRWLISRGRRRRNEYVAVVVEVLMEYGGAAPVRFVGGEKRLCGVVSPEVMVMRVSPEISEGGSGDCAAFRWEVVSSDMRGRGRRWLRVVREREGDREEVRRQ